MQSKCPLLQKEARHLQDNFNYALNVFPANFFFNRSLECNVPLLSLTWVSTFILTFCHLLAGISATLELVWNMLTV